jgi:TPP-dependent indolepyruvate ferredoxin oxidoreductase alpha subunit
MKQASYQPQTTVEEADQVRKTNTPPTPKTCQDCRHYRQFYVKRRDTHQLTTRCSLIRKRVASNMLACKYFQEKPLP